LLQQEEFMETVVDQYFLKEFLLNFLIVLIPIFFFHRLIPILDDFRGKVYLGLIFSVSALLSMMFPIVGGTDFLWDLRWIALTLSVLYGGIVSGAITASVIVTFRFKISGDFSPAFLNVLVMAILFVIIFLCVRNYYLRTKRLNKFFLALLFSNITFLITYAAIATHYWIMNDLSSFNFDFFSFFLPMAFSYVFSYMLFAYFSENIILDHEIKERIVAADKMEIISELAASIAHEVRNPLTVAKGFLQLNMGGVQNPEHMDLILSELEEANRVVTNYLDFAKPEINMKKSINMSLFLTDLVELLTPFATYHGVSLTHEIEEGIIMYGDSSRIRQALVNIIKNAIEASKHGGVVKVSARSSNGNVEMVIKDTGVGLSKEQINNLGQPYYSTKTKGTGLGLMVTFKLIKAMSGKIQYESKVQEGTTVTVVLPMNNG
jgi:two-component system sporulation sensor kinase B